MRQGDRYCRICLRYLLTRDRGRGVCGSCRGERRGARVLRAVVSRAQVDGLDARRA